MSSWSSKHRSDDDDDKLILDMNESNVDLNGDIHTIIQSYCYRIVDIEESMFAKNDFVRTCRSTREWNQEITFDVGDLGKQIEEELNSNIIGRGDSIINNVEYVFFDSNRQKLIVVCAQQGALGTLCLWCLHARLSKPLGGICRISYLKNQYTCTTPILNAGHH
ncbi:hypothetical protein M5K25_012592 [Dendrobium thyrsiflorum]|uniref:Uncharacterized protein n=1 Tax=Dendrobium thyrsiflorum TaxID=117978 RepID=A0ABD0V4F4_DENTH